MRPTPASGTKCAVIGTQRSYNRAVVHPATVLPVSSVDYMLKRVEQNWKFSSRSEFVDFDDGS